MIPPFALLSAALPAKTYGLNSFLPLKVVANLPAPSDTHLLIDYRYANGSQGNFTGILPEGATETIIYLGTPEVSAPEIFVVKVTSAGRTFTTQTTIHPNDPVKPVVTSDPAPGTAVTTRTIKVTVVVPVPAEIDYHVEIVGDRCYCVDTFVHPVLRAGQTRLEFEVPVKPYNYAFSILFRIGATDHDLSWSSVSY